MNLLKIGADKYVNTERVTYIHAKKNDKVIIQFQNDVSPAGLGVPPSYLEVEGKDAENLLQWLETNAQTV